MNFHGYTSNATQQMIYGDFRPIAEREGFIVVHPEGTVDQAGNTHWNVGWGSSMIDDVGFVNALIDALIEDYKINEERIYSTGMSNGGFISYELACQLSHRIAAIASVTGSMSPLGFQNCNPQRPVPVLQIHGTNDNTVLYTGSAIGVAIEDVITYWVNHNNCDMNAVITDIDDIDMTDQSTVQHFVYANGDMGVSTELFLVENGGHTWPGAIFSFPGTNYDIDASEEAWTFLSRYDINGEIQLSELNNLSPIFDITVSPNPASDHIRVCWEKEQENTMDIKVYDANGKLMISKVNISSCDRIDVSGISSGLYFINMLNASSGRSSTRRFIRL